jgi:NAD(P)-dependent dehydrogenase (short-subunit alcohol dehydrogenase family)
VRVNTVQPGAFRTDVARHWPPEMTRRLAARPALRRIGEPREICGAVLYLAGDAASYTTGTCIRVDGGIS